MFSWGTRLLTVVTNNNSYCVTISSALLTMIRLFPTAPFCDCGDPRDHHRHMPQSKHWFSHWRHPSRRAGRVVVGRGEGAAKGGGGDAKSEHRFPAPSSKECRKPVLGVWARLGVWYRHYRNTLNGVEQLRLVNKPGGHVTDSRSDRWTLSGSQRLAVPLRNFTPPAAVQTIATDCGLERGPLDLTQHRSLQLLIGKHRYQIFPVRSRQSPWGLISNSLEASAPLC